MINMLFVIVCPSFNMARPDRFFILVVNTILVIFLHLVPVDTQGPVTSCVPQIKIRKNTVYTASSYTVFNISCPVTYCNEDPVVKWLKIDHTNKFIHINKSDQVTIIQEQRGLKDIISYLIFKNILTDDSGVYRCMIDKLNVSSESHNINVNVSDRTVNVNSTTAGVKSVVRWLPYVFICSGIIGLVAVVMLISFLCINKCSIKASRRRHNNVTFTLAPLNKTTSGKAQQIPEEQNNVYDAPSDDLYSDQDTGNDQERVQDMRNGQRSGNGSQQIVYASLQHPKTREPFVHHQSREQLSEYASIRIG